MSFMLVLLNIIIYRLRIKNKQGQQKKDRERKWLVATVLKKQLRYILWMDRYEKQSYRVDQ